MQFPCTRKRNPQTKETVHSGGRITLNFLHLKIWSQVTGGNEIKHSKTFSLIKQRCQNMYFLGLKVIKVIKCSTNSFFRRTLVHLLKHLDTVQKNEGKNKMTTENLAIVVSCCFLWFKYFVQLGPTLSRIPENTEDVKNFVHLQNAVVRCSHF